MWGKGYVIASAGACGVLVGNLLYLCAHTDSDLYEDKMESA